MDLTNTWISMVVRSGQAYMKFAEKTFEAGATALIEARDGVIRDIEKDPLNG